MLFSELAHYFQKLENTPSRNEMTEILADLFHRVREGEIGKICYLLLGRVAPLYEAVEFGIAEKLIIRAIAQTYEVNEDVVQRAYKKMGDLGTAAESCYHVLKHDNKKHMSVAYVFENLEALARMSGEGSQEKKIDSLSELLRSIDSLAVRYLVRIPLDKLRLGFSDMTILDGLSWMLIGNKSLRPKLEEVYNVRPDIGFIAQSVKEKGIAGLGRVHSRVGAPILAALCQRLPNAEEMIKKMGEVSVEAKYDGVRVQIHYQVQNSKLKTQSFSRNLENTTQMFPELQDIGKQLNAKEVILDTEAVGIDPNTGKLVSFQETTTRKRKHDIAATLLKVPLKFFVFDILYKDGKDLLSLPLSDRRNILEKTVKTGKILVVSPCIVTSNPQELRDFHDKKLREGLEGAVVKKWNGIYEPGRRGYGWVKFKEEEGQTGKLTDTIDAVIMGYYRGQGKRAGFGIGAFLVGVKKSESFVTITKIGTGISDKLWKDLRTKLNAIKTKNQPKEYTNVNKLFIPDIWVEPKIVVEIAGDDLTKSATHGAGVAVRFPRLVRIRTDKFPRDVTTVSELYTMFSSQGDRPQPIKN
ncbi:ATP-dependent DNA ligase [Candidatus Gottesmanbacteria bacterium]|nr:ATP-dependent DNA ligase [Candidatus Gottesmanbacteria bacterium]